MSPEATMVTAVAIVAATVSLTVVHYNQTTYQAQLACLDAGGSWETREHSNEIGCRFTKEKR
jgi:hypothetical protein